MSIEADCPLERKGLERVADRVKRRMGSAHLGMTIRVVSDAEIRSYNRKFLGKDRPTDVLSFPVRREPFEEDERYLGDIVIAAPTATRNASRYGISLQEEVRNLIVHGTLHLLGFDHEADQGEMAALELSLRSRLRAGGREGRTTRRAPGPLRNRKTLSAFGRLKHCSNRKRKDLERRF
ncbi:MAG: rRNA maturation RNase YbeY [Acidobacteria bacterium]|nr:rRNA maturation RNase YbeY [Acidobacteriota bacterium]